MLESETLTMNPLKYFVLRAFNTGYEVKLPLQTLLSLGYPLIASLSSTMSSKQSAMSKSILMLSFQVAWETCGHLWMGGGLIPWQPPSFEMIILPWELISPETSLYSVAKEPLRKGQPSQQKTLFSRAVISFLDSNKSLSKEDKNGPKCPLFRGSSVPSLWLNAFNDLSMTSL